MDVPIDSNKYRVFEIPTSGKYVVACRSCGWAEGYDRALLVVLDVKFLRRQAEQHICNPKLEVE